MNNPVHPDAILREDVLAALGVSVSDAAKSVGVARVTLTLGSAPVSGGTGSISPARQDQHLTNGCRAVVALRNCGRTYSSLVKSPRLVKATSTLVRHSSETGGGVTALPVSFW